MATYLSLVQDLARQSGTLAGGVTIATVTGQSARPEKLVAWIQKAWEDIQNQRQWNWMKAEFDGAITAGTKRYTGASFGLTRLRKWAIETPHHHPFTIYKTATGQSDETELYEIPYDTWRLRYDRRTHDAMRPIEYAISPANEFCIGPTPDDAYTLRGEYWKTPQTLVGNTDEPEAPSHLHQVIVHRAMMLMGESDESPITIQTAEREYIRMFALLCEEQLPPVDMMRGNALVL